MVSETQKFTYSQPLPGSDAAQHAGCTCPVLDNCHGRGYYGDPDQFVIVEGCPIHAGDFQEISEMHNKQLNYPEQPKEVVEFDEIGDDAKVTAVRSDSLKEYIAIHFGDEKVVVLKAVSGYEAGDAEIEICSIRDISIYDQCVLGIISQNDYAKYLEERDKKNAEEAKKQRYTAYEELRKEFGDA